MGQQILEASNDQALRDLHSGSYAHRFFLIRRDLARVYRMMGRWHECLATCQMVLDTATKYSLSSRIIQGHMDFGSAYVSMGEWDKAIAECETVLSLSPSGLYMEWITIPLGEAYLKADQLSKGIALLERRKAYAKRIGRGALIECECCLALAEGYVAARNLDKARANVDEALQIALEQGYAFHEAKAYRILGEILATTDFLSAEDHFVRSLEIMQRTKARNEEGVTELSWGRACKQHGDVDQARTHLTHAAEIFEELGTTRYLEWTREDIADLRDN